MKATQQLRDEHEGVNIMLNILEKLCQQLATIGSLNKEHFEGILEFLKVFVDKMPSWKRGRPAVSCVDR